ncbi:hypothetical protein IJ531_00955 [bacterium]|nr:hypothetical protein [bacterium]
MTNSLIMQLKIEKTKAQRELDELNIKITRLLNELATKSCPFFEDISEIDAQGIEQAGDELYEVQQKALALQNKIKKISSELGE